MSKDHCADTFPNWEQYRQAQKDTDARVEEIRAETGMPSRGGMSR